MRSVTAQEISAAVASLCDQACHDAEPDLVEALQRAVGEERSPKGRAVLGHLLENARLAGHERIPLCQDCGVALVFLDIGQEVQVVGGDLQTAVNAGVRRGYREGFLRCSMVAHPWAERRNTGDNTPAIVHCRIVPGEQVTLCVAPKGGGSENMSRLFMLKPADGPAGIVRSVVRAVDEAGANPCPPLVVGVGIGGTAEYAMLLAKRAALRPIGSPAAEPADAAMESEIRDAVNHLGIGPLGLGGTVTALAVHIATYPCHIASLPVGVNLQCHSARHKQVTL